MKKLTLQQQWDELIAKSNLIVSQHLNEFFESHPKPEALFKVDFVGTINQIEIVEFTVSYKSENQNTFYRPYLVSGKPPTNKLVNELTKFIEAIQVANKSIYIRYKDVGIGAYKYEDIVPEKGLAFSASDLEAESKRRNELYAPREGYTACQYCRKQVPTESMVEATIIGRGRKQVWNSWMGRYESKAVVTSDRLKFCSGKCAVNEQMSREG